MRWDPIDRISVLLRGRETRVGSLCPLCEDKPGRGPSALVDLPASALPSHPSPTQLHRCTHKTRMLSIVARAIHLQQVRWCPSLFSIRQGLPIVAFIFSPTGLKGLYRSLETLCDVVEVLGYSPNSSFNTLSSHSAVATSALSLLPLPLPKHIAVSGTMYCAASAQKPLPASLISFRSLSKRHLRMALRDHLT